MREIKFRGISLESNNFIYGVPIISGIHAFIVTPNNRACDLGSRVEPETVGQYTGLKDKNGVEIYERDVLEAEHKLKTQKFKRKYQVIFNEKGYWDAISLDDKPVRLCYAGFDKCEVIGNIYENPELLGG